MNISDVASFRILGVLSITFAIAFVAICIPAGIYSANEIDFALPLATLLAVALPWAALAAVLLSIPFAMRNRTLLRLLAAAWFALAVSVWVSASFLVFDVGVLDGRTQIDVPASQQILSAIVLLATASLSALAAFRVQRRALVAIACLTLAQLGGSLFHLATVSPRGARTAEADPATVAELFRLSDQKNVLVVVLDTFQSTLFEDYLEKNPSIREDLAGFTFYRDTTGSAPTTYASMPPIHSGVKFDPERSLKATYQELVRSGSFVAQLARSGYHASLVHAVIGVCPEGALCVEDYQVSDGVGRATFSYLSLLDVSLLRAAPARVKGWIYNDGAWRARLLTDNARTLTRPIRHQRFLKRFGDSVHVAGTSPTIKFIHLMTTHPPIEMSDACAPLAEPLPFSRANFGLPATCSINTVRHLLDRLKSLGVYDASFIAVIADHGASLRPNPESNRIAGAAMPLLLVKPAFAQGPMKISDKPAEIRDLAATVCKETGDCRSLDGIPLDELPESRQRSYFHYVWRN
ncbi:MAG: hypothetical protein O3A53_08515 [Acidobacteria bacterium]|nr:hypothetical protein [Acidobacteriota bacterium]MDA1234830.1 hypothetical protein [Acidobacteriota bacterium]